MNQVLDDLELDDRCGVVVLTGEGDAFSAGMDLKDFFRATDNKPDIERHRLIEKPATGSGVNLCSTASLP
jgi:trans-feruloyl-CoA hydratase/vanillin synthase